MNCNKCLLGAPMYLCWEESCPNKNYKKNQEKEWATLIQECLLKIKEVKINETKRDN